MIGIRSQILKLIIFIILSIYMINCSPKDSKLSNYGFHPINQFAKVDSNNYYSILNGDLSYHVKFRSKLDSFIVTISFFALKRNDGKKANLDHLYVSCCALLEDSLIYKYSSYVKKRNELVHSLHFADKDSSLRKSPDFCIKFWAWGYKINKSGYLDSLNFISSKYITIYPEKILEMDRFHFNSRKYK